MMTEIDRFVGVLKKVPAVQLKLIEMLPELVNDLGLDFEKIAAHQKEVDLAITEAKAYAEDVQRAIRNLEKMDAKQDITINDYDPYTDPNRDDDDE